VFSSIIQATTFDHLSKIGQVGLQVTPYPRLQTHIEKGAVLIRRLVSGCFGRITRHPYKAGTALLPIAMTEVFDGCYRGVCLLNETRRAALRDD
jgi:hypothetical protein